MTQISSKDKKATIKTCKTLFLQYPLNHDLRYACVKVIFELSTDSEFKEIINTLIGTKK